ncbi:hypothetical protein FIBSPDRAFT_752924 [Athelia psychrophila]|uniref:TM7S3/TM198-like domain-containing protein n=1 Tax=Athelia psychrophila TaxID=1759441 RepID=A0A166CJX9_9AGAM|nr:hypothetical protein FIBSPDRAFT_752924 [Fibularhizoctonia sp. CBS 109695]
MSQNILQDVARRGAVIENLGGSIIVVNSDTAGLIAQGTASDGAGTDYDAAALIWLIGSFALGVPLAFAGVRGWRLTLGSATGLTTGLFAWAALVNTISSAGLPDIALAGIVAGFMVVGFAIGLFPFGRIAGIATLGALGGLAIGVRVVLFGDNLLVGKFFVNWLIAGACGLVGVILVFMVERFGVIALTASTGTFLIALGVDLTLHKQSGMSRGLRFLFDRNSSHLADIVSNGYKPSLSTIITLAVSLVLIPILTFAQHKIFRDPFDRTPPPEEPFDFSPDAVNSSQEMMVGVTPDMPRASGPGVLKSRFSGFSTK